MPEPDRWATDNWDRLVGTSWQPRPGAEADRALPMVGIGPMMVGPPPPPPQAAPEQPQQARRVHIRREVELQ
eukprot:2188511-Heterocapsa_arctica.AAC.1